MTKRTKWLARCALMPIILSTGTAVAGPLDWAPYVEYGIEHSTNLFSNSDDERSDTIHHAAIGLLANWPVSKQQFVLGAEVSRFYYQRFNELDHTEHDVQGAWRFQLGRAFYGTASYQDERYLDDFSNRDNMQANFIRRRQPQVEGYLEVTPSWRIRAQAGYLTIDRSLESSSRFEREETQGELEWQYQGLPGSVFGVGAEVVDGEFPGRDSDDPLSPRFTQPTAFLAADWKYSGVSRIRTRLGYTRRDNKGGDDSVDNSDRDFSGVTGRLGYQRKLSGKTQLYGEVYRQIYSVDNVDANFVRETGVKLQATWTYSPKLNVETGIAHSELDYQALSGGDSRSDTIDEFAANLVYQPHPALAVIANTGYIKRDSNSPQESYDGIVGGLSLRVTLGYVPETGQQFGE